MVGIRVHVEHNMHTYYRHFPLSINNIVRRPLVLLLCLILTLMEPYENIENLFSEGRRDVGVVREIGGADNPASRYQPPRLCLSTRGRVVPYKESTTLLSEPVSSPPSRSDNLGLPLFALLSYKTCSYLQTVRLCDLWPEVSKRVSPQVPGSQMVIPPNSVASTRYGRRCLIHTAELFASFV
jgi:hypothetical protein